MSVPTACSLGASGPEGAVGGEKGGGMSTSTGGVSIHASAEQEKKEERVFVLASLGF